MKSGFQEFLRGKFRNKYWGIGRIIRELKQLEEEEDYEGDFGDLSRKRLQQQLTSEKDKYRKRKKLGDYFIEVGEHIGDITKLES